ncbi:TetR/AcrR family transcriptional regulator [Phycicoccus endophyticus]|uniref:TetR/AcrR family transcriptional regulator n=1 Tax=Phycicoccus endophyticus TaxID=1690220 RepID=A0A7G9R297_9MICO|nr:TetR/AcrR family transcriptional regulator [Phycicoccus endophyticus]NHI19615.1 TetR/AcrR family transcriptional regulator [Phycicoccus endophyticus]QNN49722.1 TetR/AcrR family transcriptional regulator [Phycicoccus endophyticus]GGL34493.1 TetR family transcriptional regulator [Phycicoccus endophyticus]
MPGPDAARALRKDAAANRERLLRAASELFAQRGLDVTLNDIARYAGVGVGTAYRRFANKEEVIDALFEERMTQVEQVAREAAEDPDSWSGLLHFLEGALDLQHGDRGLTQMMNNPVLGDARVAEVRDRIAPLVTVLVERAKAEGVVRPDLDQTDLIFVQLALSAVMDRTRGLAPDLYRRYLTVFLDGIRTDRGTFTPLPVPPLTAYETHEAMTRASRRRPG